MKTYTEIYGHYEAGERHREVLGDDGQGDHLVPGQSVHHPPESITQEHQRQIADQTVGGHQLETLTDIR